MHRFVVYSKNFSLFDWFGLGGKKSVPPPPTSGSQNKELTLSIWGQPTKLAIESDYRLDPDTNKWVDCPLTAAQQKVVDSFVLNHAAYLNKARKPVESYCVERHAMWGDDSPALDIDNIYSYVRTTSLFVPSEAELKQGKGVVLMCDIAPDEEHGMGVEFSPKGKVMRIGQRGEFY